MSDHGVAHYRVLKAHQQRQDSLPSSHFWLRHWKMKSVHDQLIKWHTQQRLMASTSQDHIRYFKLTERQHQEALLPEDILNVIMNYKVSLSDRHEWSMKVMRVHEEYGSRIHGPHACSCLSCAPHCTSVVWEQWCPDIGMYRGTYFNDRHWDNIDEEDYVIDGLPSRVKKGGLVLPAVLPRNYYYTPLVPELC